MSTAKKVILAIGQNPLTQRVQAFTLELRGYRVVQVHPETAEMIGEVKRIDLILCDLELGDTDGVRMTLAFKEIAPDVPVLLISRRLRKHPPGSVTNGFLGSDATMVELIHTVRLLACRKRGPKKPWASVPVDQAVLA